jgi:hypothetical protein
MLSAKGTEMVREKETKIQGPAPEARPVEGHIMLEQIESQKEIAGVFEGIESQMDRAFAVQKDAIEKELAERLSREKEEAQRKVEAAEREFAEGKRVLDGHKAALAELKTAKEQIQGQIKGHLDRALSCQQMMEKMSNQAYEEYEKINHLSLELDGIRQRAEQETSILKKHLEDQYGIKAEFQAVFETLEALSEIRQEMLKMKKVQELLAALSGPVAAEPPQEPTAERPVLRGHPETRFTEPMETADAPEDEALLDESEPPAEYDIVADAAAEESRMLMGRLAQYRRTEPVLNGTEFAYFQNGKKMVLDGESFIGTMAKVSDVAKGLHVNLGQKGMSKDLFLIKQEILNQQEILRKSFLRAVRFCEKEDGTLPRDIVDVLNVRGMKDILERLTFGNWSNAADFQAFVEYVASLRNAFKSNASPSLSYVKSILGQLEGSPIVQN